MKKFILIFFGLWGLSLFILSLCIVFVSMVTVRHKPIPTVKSSPSEEQERDEIATLPKTKAPIYNEHTQFIAFSFDGSRSLALWEDTLAFADELRSAGTPIAFTYFISGVYLIPKEQKHLYHLSWLRPSESAIAYGDSAQETDARITYINIAYTRGHAIGSHLNGHFDGAKWKEAEWCEELQAFDDILYDHMSEPLHRSVAFAVPRVDIIGIRTPSLSHNDALFTCLAQYGYQYDASLQARIGDGPGLLASGIWEFPLVSMPFRERSVLSMDYNMYMIQTKGVDTLHRGTPEWESAKQEVLTAYRAYFAEEYQGVRMPLNIGNHFSTWNDGVYLEALKEFAREVCGKPDVACVNYNTLTEVLQSRNMAPTP